MSELTGFLKLGVSFVQVKHDPLHITDSQGNEMTVQFAKTHLPDVIDLFLNDDRGATRTVPHQVGQDPGIIGLPDGNFVTLLIPIVELETQVAVLLKAPKTVQFERHPVYLKRIGGQNAN